MVLEVQAIAIREEKEVREIQIGKEEFKLSLFAVDMILYIQDHKDATRKLLEFINEFGKVEATKLIHRNLLHFYKLTKKAQKEKIKKSKIIKFLRIKLPKKSINLCSINYKMFMKEMEDNTKR